ncbi:hypothetical protein C0J52_00648 [Blattella germanica]|nr:hypothetical protein C0J52_00648 [Blattella germanica]
MKKIRSLIRMDLPEILEDFLGEDGLGSTEAIWRRRRTSTKAEPLRKVEDDREFTFFNRRTKDETRSIIRAKNVWTSVGRLNDDSCKDSRKMVEIENRHIKRNNVCFVFQIPEKGI